MGEVSRKRVKRLFRDAGLLDEVVRTIADDRERMNKLAEEFADEIVEILKKDADFKRRVLESAILNPKFEDEVIKRIRKEL